MIEEPRPRAEQAGLVREIYTVSRLNRLTKELLEGGFPAFVWVEGEVSNLSRPASGHIYFSLRDDQAQVRCALFRPQLRLVQTLPENGAHVVVRARVSLYEGRGEFQLIIEQLEEAGEGALRRALEALKRRLHQEGLFDVAHKKPLPRLPRRIGIITSPTGAVLRDIVTTLRRRFPAIAMLLYPISVQGQGAAREIAATIALASTRSECDALILARGGGSLEDLWAFNEEIVARAIYACQLPIVSGVGHETDVTIADLVADMRAPTPTAAAELLSPDSNEWRRHFRQKQDRLVRLAHDAIYTRQQKLDWLAARLIHPRQRIRLLDERFANLQSRLRLATLTGLRTRAAALLTLQARVHQRSPRARVHGLRVRCDQLYARLVTGLRHSLQRRDQQLRKAAHALHALSPLATLERGYAIVRSVESGRVIRGAREVRLGEDLEARLARGRLGCIVTDVRED